jgi:hypothetical protein
VGALFAAGLALAPPAPARAGERLQDAPVVWQDDDRRSIPQPKERDPNLIRDGVDESFFDPIGRFFNPARLMRKVGTIFGADHVAAASNVNALDEVPNSTWFTNRIGLRPMSPEDVAAGPTTGDGPDRSGTWTVIRAKTEGVTPGFNIKDAKGIVYVIKFDPPCCPGMSSGAGVITGRLLYAAGYNVPEDFVVNFRRDDLRLGEKVTIVDPDGTKRPMTVEDLDGILSRVKPDPDGSWRAIASKFLSGKPAGPFDWKGRRKDDPNDPVRHENRRELRGFRVMAAWLGHFDTKQQNTLDMYVEDSGRHYLRHHFIDFASTLGAGATGPFPKANYEYSFDFPASLGRAASVGLYQSPWRALERPAGLDEVGYFESNTFEPSEWKPLDPNAAFANLTDRDGYWAAKIVTAFTDAQLDQAVARGKYRNPEAAAYIARMLKERRDKVGRHWFDRVPPLDFFTAEGSLLKFHDLGAERGVYPGTTARYRLRVAAADENRGAAAFGTWVESDRTEFDWTAAAQSEAVAKEPAAKRPFLAVEAEVDRGSGWSGPIKVYVSRASNRVVAMER